MAHRIHNNENTLTFSDGNGTSVNEQPTSSFWDLIKAHFTDNSLKFAGYKMLYSTYHLLDKLYDYPKEEFKITPEDVEGYEDFPQLMNARNEMELAQYKSIADEIRFSRKVKSEHGILANLGANLLGDPIGWVAGLAGGGVVNATWKSAKLATKLPGMMNVVAKGAVGGAVAGGTDVVIRNIGGNENVEDLAIGSTSGMVLGGLCSAAPEIVKRLHPFVFQRIKNSCAKISEGIRKPFRTNRLYDELPPVDIRLPNVELETPASELKVAPTFLGLDKILPNFSPDLSMAKSRFASVREFGANIVPYSFKMVDNAGNVAAQPHPLASIIDAKYNIRQENFNKVLQSKFKEYLKDEAGMKEVVAKFKSWETFELWSGKDYDEFNKLVMHEMITGEASGIKSVDEFAEYFNKSVQDITQEAWNRGVYKETLEAYKVKLAQEQKLLSEKKFLTKTEQERLNTINKKIEKNDYSLSEISNIKDPVYFPRIYNQSKLKRNQNEFKQSLMQAYRDEGSNKSDFELTKSVDETYNKIIGLTRHGKHDADGLRRNELARTLDIPSSYLEDYLVLDTAAIFNRLNKTLTAGMEFVNRFGTLNKNDILEGIKNEVAVEEVKLRNTIQDEKKLNKAIDKLNNAAEKDKEIVSAIWDRVRGDARYPYDNMEKAGRFVMNMNIARSLGQLTTAPMYDVFTTSMHLGVGNFLKSTYKLIKGKELFSNKQTADAFVHAINAAEVSRFWDVEQGISDGIFMKGSSALAKGTVWATRGQWIDEKNKTIIGYATEEMILKLCKKEAAGQKISNQDAGFLRKLAISKQDSKNIAKGFEQYGEVGKDGLYRSGWENWENESAKEALLAAVRTMQSQAVLTPTSGSTPLFFDHPFLKAAFQFRRCMFAGFSKATIPFLQNIRNNDFANYMVPLAIGGAACYLREEAKDLSNDKERTVEEKALSAASSMDVFSYTTFISDTANKFHEGTKNSYVGFQRITENALGAPYGFAKDAYYASAGLKKYLSGDKVASNELHAFRRLLPTNNLFWWCRGFNYLEQLASDELNIKKPKKKRK